MTTDAESNAPSTTSADESVADVLKSDRGWFLLVLGAFGSVVVGGVTDLGYFDGTIYALATLTALGGLLFYLLPREERRAGL